MDAKKFKSLLNKQEGVKLDFKLKLTLKGESSKKELAKDVCAIANSKGGRGYIIVGIHDKSKAVVGLLDSELLKEEQVQQIVSSRCEPPIPISVDTLIVENKKVCVITIYNGEQKPYQIRESGAFYIRRGSTTDTMRKLEILECFEENLDFNLETSLIVRSDVSYLNEEILKKYFKNKSIELNEENKDFLLESSGIAFKEKESNKLRCTLGGLLVFSDNNSMFLPQNMIKIINKVNKDIDEVTIIQGNILDMIDKSEKRIKEIIIKDYPIISIVEGIQNALLYRKYSAINRIIEVIIGYKSIIVISPGALIKENKQNNNKRNIWLYEKLITIDNNKRILNNGKGFIRMKEAFYGIGKVKLINSEDEDSFKIIYPGINRIKDN